MHLIKKFQYLFFASLLLILSTCRKDKYEAPVEATAACYPPDVDAIITKKCATAGCHNSATKSGNLDFSTFDHLLDGNNIGATVIPFSPGQSTLLFFTNTDTLKGPVIPPTMPVNSAPLSASEYLTLKNWIAQGAPDCNGVIPFSGDPNRKKIYIVNQGCDLLSVFDAQRGVIMRYKDLGVQPGVAESPHDVIVTEDGKYALVVFLNADVVQVIRTEDDSIVKNIPIGNGQLGNWNKIVATKDSRTAYAVDYSGNRIAIIDLVAQTSVTTPTFPLVYGSGMHGLALNATDDTLYVTEDLGNGLITIPVHDINSFEERNLRTLHPDTGILGIHQIDFTPDFSRYFITCGHANQVWVFNTATNALLDTFHVGATPLEMAVSTDPAHPYIFITCQEAATFNNFKGSVEVINYQTLLHKTILQAGWQPHGIAADNEKGLLYVVNRNVNLNGPAPHHTTNCGRNGSLNIFDLYTLQRKALAPELSSDPYEIDVRN